jgi:hypothetical protein
VNIFEEHKTLGPRKIKKGIPRIVFIAAACDPRTKNLIGIPDDEHSKIWNDVKDEMRIEIDKINNHHKQSK